MCWRLSMRRQKRRQRPWWRPASRHPEPWQWPVCLLRRLLPWLVPQLLKPFRQPQRLSHSLTYEFHPERLLVPYLWDILYVKLFGRVNNFGRIYYERFPSRRCNQHITTTTFAQYNG